jgi:Raf kinase inhibitor-like YbhB/YbcL family protein
VLADGKIADQYSAYHDNISPALSWTRRLEADSYALIVEDPDAPTPQPFVHWTAWNIAPAAQGVPAGLAGAVQGKNGKAAEGWWGPHPSDGRLHHYHFQLFASSREIDVGLKPGRSEILRQLTGHVIAFGETVGVYERPRQKGPEKESGPAHPALPPVGTNGVRVPEGKITDPQSKEEGR